MISDSKLIRNTFIKAHYVPDKVLKAGDKDKDTSLVSKEQPVAAGHAGAMGKSMHTTEEVEGKQYSRQSVTERIISKPVLLYFSSI